MPAGPVMKWTPPPICAALTPASDLSPESRRPFQPDGSVPGPAIFLSGSAACWWSCATSGIAATATAAIARISCFMPRIIPRLKKKRGSFWIVLPVELQPQLNLARRAGVQDLPEGIGRRVAGGQKRRAGVVETRDVGIGEPLRVVERVDRVGAKLDALRPVERPVFRQREIGLIASRLAPLGSH